MPPRVRPGRTHGRSNTPRHEIQAGADLSPRQPAVRRSHKFTALTEFCKRLLRTAFGLFPFGGESGIFSGMTQDLSPIAVHPTGEQSAVALGGAAAPPQPLVVDSFAGSVRVEWDHATAFTPLGQLPFF